MLAVRPQVTERWRVRAFLHRSGVGWQLCGSILAVNQFLGSKWDGFTVARWHRTPLQKKVWVLQRAGGKKTHPLPSKRCNQAWVSLHARWGNPLFSALSFASSPCF